MLIETMNTKYKRTSKWSNCVEMVSMALLYRNITTVHYSHLFNPKWTSYKRNGHYKFRIPLHWYQLLGGSYWQPLVILEQVK